MVTRVGFIGLGLIGKLMAINVAKAGFDLMVCDLRREPLEELARLGAKIASSPAEVGEHAEVIEVAVVDDAQVEAVLLEEDGVLAGATVGTVVAIHSTIHPRTVKKVAEQAEKRGVAVIDAQMGAGGWWVEAHQLCFMVGGEKAHLERCRPVLEASGGGPIFHAGGLGTGAATKLAQQAIAVGTMIAVAEGMLLGKRAGVQPETLAQVVRASSARSEIADKWLDRYGRMDSKRVNGLYKGLLPVLELAHEHGVSLPSLAVAQQLLSLRMLAEP